MLQEYFAKRIKPGSAIQELVKHDKVFRMYDPKYNANKNIMNEVLHRASTQRLRDLGVEVQDTRCVYQKIKDVKEEKHG